MKKTFFMSLKALCVGAMALAAVSCYDDSGILEKIEGLDERLTKVEKDLNDDIENLSKLTATVKNLETTLNKAISDGDAAVTAALEQKLTALEAELTAAQQAGDASIVAALEAEKASLTEALTALQDGLTSVTGSVQGLQTAITVLETTFGTKYQDLLSQLDAVDGKVDGKVADVATAIAALKESLEAADAKINSDLLAAIAKISVVDVAEVGGKVILTLADGSTVELSKPLTNVENTGLVTIEEEDGVKYWAVVGKDGHTGVPVGHPDQVIEFQLSDAGELEYRVNGSEWVATGIKTSVSDANSAIITDFVDSDDYVEITINGTKVLLPKYVANDAELELSRTDFFLRYEGEKKVEVFADGVVDCYVMAKPNGWKAVINGDFLTVTAPTKAAINIGAAETEGEILLHATTEAGTCKVVKLDVTAGPGLTLALDITGKLVVKNAYSSEHVSMWGDVSFGFDDFIFGIATPDDFNADPKAYVEFYNTNWSAPNYMDPIFPSMYNIAWGGEYVEGEYEVDVIETTVAECYRNYYWSDPEPGARFVVWVAPIIPGSEGKADFDNIVYADYVNVVWEVEASAVTHSDITLTANVAGASQFIIGCIAESDYNSEWNPSTFEAYMNAAMGGPWSSFTKYGAAEALGLVLPAEELPEEFNLSDVMGTKLMAGENYKVWVMPLFDHLAKLDEANSYPEYDYYVYDYSAFKFDDHFLPFVLDVKTNDLVAGGDYEAELELNRCDYTSIYVDVTPVEGTESIYYYWYSEDEYNCFENDAEIMADLLANCYSPLTEADQLSKTYINPAETYILATVSIGVDGKYGEVVAEPFSTLEIPTTATITVEHVETVLSEDGKTYTVKVKVNGGTKVMGYNIKDNESNWASFPKNVCVNGAKDSYYGYQMADVVDGEATLTFSYSSYKNDYYVAAYTVADGAVDAICAESLKINLF